jgi:uncharacterized protein
MKWSIEQLNKHKHQGLEFHETIDLNDYLKDEVDLQEISPTDVKGFFSLEGFDYVFDLEIETTLTMLCAKTLKQVEVPLSFSVTERFSLKPHDDARLIDKNTVDLIPIIWSNIYLEKPLKVVHPDAKDLTFDEPSETKGHPGLKDLAKFK